MKTRMLVYLAAGAEELETVSVVDVLRRAGVEVTVAAVGGDEEGMMECSRGVWLGGDRPWAEGMAEEYDGVVVPGGMGGVKALLGEEGVLREIRAAWDAGKWVASICAGPMVLGAAGVLSGRKFTCYPGCEAGLEGECVGGAVCVDGRLVTGAGPGAALDFALTLAAKVAGTETARKVAEGMLARLPAAAEQG